MDYDVDGYISKAEWKQYFSATAAALSADEFLSVVEVRCLLCMVL